MKFNWKSLVSLKVPVLVSFFLLWNAGFGLAMYLGGGGSQGALSPIGMHITGYVCLIASIFSISVATIKPVQTALIAPTRMSNFTTKEFYFLALLTGLLGISRFAFPMLSANA